MIYGAIDYIALEFKNENLKGEIVPALLELVQNQIVRVIDLVIVRKHEDGNYSAVEMNQLAPDVLAVFDALNPEISGMIQVEDIENLAAVMENGTTAAALLFENLWAIRFLDAVHKADGRLLEHLRIPPEVVEDAMEKIASVEEQ